MRNYQIRSRENARPGALDENIKVYSFGGLFVSALASSLIWAGCDSFLCGNYVWISSFAINVIVFVCNWIIYLYFKNTNKLLASGLIGLLSLINLFWLFGFAGFYFYFLFGGMNFIARWVIIFLASGSLLYRSVVIAREIVNEMKKNKNLLQKMYDERNGKFVFSRRSVIVLAKKKPVRNPFTKMYLCAALIATPFILVLNRLAMPILGDGHGPFLVIAFFGYPIMLWESEIVVRTIITMIYYPIKIERAFGKPVLMGDW